MNIKDKTKMNMIEYLCELWDNMDNDEWNYQWENIIGMNDEEMKYFNLRR